MNTRLICPLTSETAEAMRADMLAAAGLGADMVECRLDFLTTPPDDDQLAELLADAPLPVLATCRPVREGGRFGGAEGHRLAILTQAATFGAVVAIDIEADTDPADRPAPESVETILSHHDFETTPADLDDQLAALDATDATINKLAFTATNPADALRAWDLIKAARKPTVALAMGEAGVASRLLAKCFGAWGTFAALSAETTSAPGQPTLDEFIHLYRWHDVSYNTQLFGIIGCPVGHSMSPAIHNAAFSAVGHDGVYVPLRIEPTQDEFSRFLDAIRSRPNLRWRGLSVTIPHKEHALAYVGQANCDPLAVKIGAVNTITIAPDGSLRGDNTDYAAALDALVDRMEIPREGVAGKHVAILGAGGASRALVAALTHYGARVTIYNRTVSRAESLASEFGQTARPIAEAANTDAEIVINCTPIGMHPNIDATPLPTIPPSVRVVFDTIYNPIETQLLAQARAANCLTVSGIDMFVNQAVAQFETWTNQPAPREIMRNVVLQQLR